jgi:hypothetical protein
VILGVNGLGWVYLGRDYKRMEIDPMDGMNRQNIGRSEVCEPRGILRSL